MRFKKHAEVRRLHHEKVIHSPPSLLPFALEEKEEATQKDGDKIEELRQTPIELGVSSR
jgi:hypothetical protein